MAFPLIFLHFLLSTAITLPCRMLFFPKWLFPLPLLLFAAGHRMLPSVQGIMPLLNNFYFLEQKSESRRTTDEDGRPFSWMRKRGMSSLGNRKNIFRDRLASRDEEGRGQRGMENKEEEEEEQHLERMPVAMAMAQTEEEEQPMKLAEQREFHFLGQQKPTEEEGKGQNRFARTMFDHNFPVHSVCGPWNSGKQASDLEWAEPADKLLKLLNSAHRKKYNMFLAPGQVTGHATNVSVAMYIESMSSFKAQTMDFEVDMYFAMGWYDRRLAHNCTHPLLVTKRPLAERIWTPDLYFLNAKFAYLQEVTTPNFMVIVYPDGLVFKTLRIDVTLSCNMDLQLFPFDKQECPMVIQSFAYIENLLNLSWHVDPPSYPIATNPELKLNDMAITGMRFERCSSPYTMFRGTGVWSCLRGYIVMKRLVLFHLIQTYIPSAMLVLVSMMTFWLDPRASPARISLTITSLLTLTTMSNGARQDLPRVSYIKAMDIWQTFSQALIFLVLLEYSFVSYFFTRQILDCPLHQHHLLAQRWCKRNIGGGKGTRSGNKQGNVHSAERMGNRQWQWQRLAPMNSNIKSNEDGSNHNARQDGGGHRLLSQNDSCQPNSFLRQRRHSSGPLHLHNRQTAIAGTLPPGTRTLDDGLLAMAGAEGRRLCGGQISTKSEFEMAGIGEEREKEEEEREEGGQAQEEKPCGKCQQRNQRRARAIDRYSRVLFPAIFVLFCAIYWLYYGWLMSEKN